MECNAECFGRHDSKWGVPCWYRHCSLCRWRPEHLWEWAVHKPTPIVSGITVLLITHRMLPEGRQAQLYSYSVCTKPWVDFISLVPDLRSINWCISIMCLTKATDGNKGMASISLCPEADFLNKSASDVAMPKVSLIFSAHFRSDVAVTELWYLLRGSSTSELRLGEMHIRKKHRTCSELEPPFLFANLHNGKRLDTCK